LGPDYSDLSVVSKLEAESILKNLWTALNEQENKYIKDLYQYHAAKGLYYLVLVMNLKRSLNRFGG